VNSPIVDAARAVYHWLVVRRLVLFDVALAAVTTGVEIELLTDGVGSVGVLPIVLTVVAGAALLLRRRAPLTVLAVTVAAAWVSFDSGAYPGGAPVLVALASIAESQERRVSVTALVPVALILMLASISSIPVSIGAWAVGVYIQTRRKYVAALEERAAHLERESEQLSAIVAQNERTAIARELHDIVAHSVTVMLLGVRGARDVLPTEPAVAAETLERVESAAEESLAELRRMLTVLREPAQDAQLRPQPSLDQLTDLIEGYRDSGMPVTLEVSGARRPLPSGVELSVYRIVEEALTNVLKHANPTRVRVMLAFEDDRLSVTVHDDGQPQVPGPPGHGLAGMRERVAVLNGHLDAGPLPGGGFEVAARLPVGEA
jgi:signal transduction histidine kinase